MKDRGDAVCFAAKSVPLFFPQWPNTDWPHVVFEMLQHVGFHDDVI
jgi:hypothetical protein